MHGIFHTLKRVCHLIVVRDDIVFVVVDVVSVRLVLVVAVLVIVRTMMIAGSVTIVAMAGRSSVWTIAVTVMVGIIVHVVVVMMVWHV